MRSILSSRRVLTACSYPKGSIGRGMTVEEGDRPDHQSDRSQHGAQRLEWRGLVARNPIYVTTFEAGSRRLLMSSMLHLKCFRPKITLQPGCRFRVGCSLLLSVYHSPSSDNPESPLPSHRSGSNAAAAADQGSIPEQSYQQRCTVSLLEIQILSGSNSVPQILSSYRIIRLSNIIVSRLYGIHIVVPASTHVW